MVQDMEWPLNIPRAAPHVTTTLRILARSAGGCGGRSHTMEPVNWLPTINFIAANWEAYVAEHPGGEEEAEVTYQELRKRAGLY